MMEDMCWSIHLYPLALTGEAGSLSEPGSHQALAVLGIALIAMGEDIGAEMAHRIYSQLVSRSPLL